jgi:Uma2 family endonuclease
MVSDMPGSLLSAEEFALLPEVGRHLALVRGQVVEEPLPGVRQGIVAAKIGIRIDRWSEAQRSGVIALRTGFILARNPDTVRGPDVCFVRAERLPPGELPDTFLDFAPDVAVEVISPSETANEVREKVQDYLAAGTALVLVLYPKTRELIAHTPDGLARTYRDDEVFTAPEVLPGFSCRVSELFV